ncbi:FkbM family methyltransferase [Terasakiella sp. SH-1]|uniref:FkbM family methyltransferase n=1 Tax=Terasakiella sp. SH-1 TaxID=2560057 RepID=UPI00142FDD9D|nr:FkbM family methyltransferase [Terasakiella sp. SH-1]
MTERYIFGAGIQGQAFLKVFQKLGLPVSGFIDSFSTRESYNDLPVQRPEAVNNKEAEIYVSVGMISEKIKEQLKTDLFQNVYDYTETVLKYPDIIHALKIYSLWYSENIEDRVNQQKLNEFRALLVDDKSRQLLDQLIRFRTSFKVEDYVLRDTEAQYFPDDVPIFEGLKTLRFVDAGAFIGDTIPPLITHSQKSNTAIDYIACFEPDKKNLKALHEQLDTCCDDAINVFVYPTGVWSRSEILNFAANQSSSSCITTQEGPVDLSQSILATSIDECLFNTRPNYIKMDIEGAEAEALKGAKKTIQTYSPVLAICLYHKPSDLWELPLMIHSMNTQYEMYLRVYGDMLLETVLYCIPKQKGN